MEKVIMVSAEEEALAPVRRIIELSRAVSALCNNA
jgi:hypothetical protein